MDIPAAPVIPQTAIVAYIRRGFAALDLQAWRYLERQIQPWPAGGGRFSDVFPNLVKGDDNCVTIPPRRPRIIGP